MNPCPLLKGEGVQISFPEGEGQVGAESLSNLYAKLKLKI